MCTQGALAAAADAAVASRRLAAAMPEYEALAARPPGASQPAWLGDPALAARVQFLCNMLAPCARNLSEVAPLSLRSKWFPLTPLTRRSKGVVRRSWIFNLLCG